MTQVGSINGRALVHPACTSRQASGQWCTWMESLFRSPQGLVHWRRPWKCNSSNCSFGIQLVFLIIRLWDAIQNKRLRL